MTKPCANAMLPCANMYVLYSKKSVIASEPYERTEQTRDLGLIWGGGGEGVVCEAARTCPRGPHAFVSLSLCAARDQQVTARRHTIPHNTSTVLGKIEARNAHALIEWFM